MGLDMYLSVRKYVSDFAYENGKNSEQVNSILASAGLGRAILSEYSPSVRVEATVGYWRKANAIHGWFVDNVADGEDNCTPMHVSREDLTGLRDDCLEVLDMRDRQASNPDEALPTAEDIMPTQSGFFFGDVEYDDWYYEYITNTAELLTELLDNPTLEDCDFEYRASW